MQSYRVPANLKFDLESTVPLNQRRYLDKPMDYTNQPSMYGTPRDLPKGAMFPSKYRFQREKDIREDVPDQFDPDAVIMQSFNKLLNR